MNFTSYTGRFFSLLAKEDLTAGIFDSFDFGDDGASAVLRVVFAISAGVILASLWSVYN